MESARTLGSEKLAPVTQATFDCVRVNLEAEKGIPLWRYRTQLKLIERA